MDRPADFIPPTLPPIQVASPAVPAIAPIRAPSRRGGRRPGAGAKPGNLNALKHGRYSRFKDALPPEPFDPAVVARSLLVEQRTEAERVAASFLRVLLEERYKRELAAAVAEHRPLPPPPLLFASKRDHARIRHFLDTANQLATLQRANEQGRIAPDNAAVAGWLHTGEDLESALPLVALLLQRSARPPLPPEAFATLLRNEIGDDQSRLAPIESTVAAFAAVAESARVQPRRTIPSNAGPAPTAAETPASLRAAAAALIAALSTRTPPAPNPGDTPASPPPPPAGRRAGPAGGRGEGRSPTRHRGDGQSDTGPPPA